MTEKAKYTLEIPLDASEIKDFKSDRRVKVVAYTRSGAVAGSTVVRLNEKGRGVAQFGFHGNPGGLRVAVGPENASDEELSHLQTISVNVAPRQWKEGRAVLTPIAISAYYWWWWLWWCRDYTITGRLVCADGSPVPGATVCAYDVDWWWWWISEYQVGCAVTDANGTFQISFRRCCGWWWWWWWGQRVWVVDPYLADRILPILQQLPGMRRPPLPDPAPDLGIFESILSQAGGATRSLTAAAPQIGSRLAGSSIDPGKLESLRTELEAKLPRVPELEALCVWPWCPWWPWWDCDADIRFRATQNCNGKVNVILDESILQTRFDIPTQLNVTLVANNQACCLAQPCQDSDCPPGDCILPIDICDTPSASVGGNPGANMAAATIGYENPGGASPGNPAGDRPFSESVLLATNFGDLFSGDYYEFEWATSKAGPYSAMPLTADGVFYRYFWDAMLNQHSVKFAPVTFNSPLGMRNVFESRQHYEANNSIGIGWDMCISCNYPTLMYWETNNTGFANGTYYLRLRVWVRPGNVGDLQYPADYPTGIVPFCGDDPEDNYVVITIDNRPAPGPGAGHPLDHPCGSPGTVHVCTTQPDCNIFSVTIAGQTVGPCANITASDSDPVEIDFMVHDTDGMLAYYSLACNYDLNLSKVLINQFGPQIGSLDRGATPSFQTSWVGPADAVGPDYASAILPNPPNSLQGATPPYWHGGTLKLTTTVGALFPETCCYQLQLWVFKRNIVNCYYGIDSNGYYNLTEMSFTVFKS